MSTEQIQMRIADVTVGTKILEPIKVGSTLLCRSGTTVSEQLKKTLPKFGITEVTVSKDVAGGLSHDDLVLSKMNDGIYSAIQQLDINDLILCATTLVNSASAEDLNLLHVLLEYDKSTYQHCVNVAIFSIMTGVALGLPLEDLSNLALGALLHDVGKLCVPLEILNKPDKLESEEFLKVKQHPYEGYKLLSELPEINSSVRQIVWQHHENYDGSGYPRGLKGSRSYRLARIVHICDVYEALCVKRPYKNQLPRKIVRQTLEQSSGTMFDPKLLNVFLDNTPMYLLGETVTQGTRVGIITDVTDRMNPIVYCHDTLFTLNQFERLGSQKAVMSYSIA